MAGSARLAAPRTYAQAVALADGRVLIEGGLDRDSDQVSKIASEIFDPRSGTSRLVPAIEGGRLWQTLIPLPDGRIFSQGGVVRVGSEWSAVAVAALFDPASGSYRRARSAAFPRSDHGATVLRDGRVLVVGGHDGPKFVHQAEIYDPRTDRWTSAAGLAVGRTQFSMTTLLDGRVLIAGGFLQPGTPTDTSELYDPRRDEWSEGPRLSAKRALHATVGLPGGDLLLIGGQEGAAGTAERYDAERGEFTFAGTLVVPRMAAAAAVLPDGSVALAGGLPNPTDENGFFPTARVERWDPRTNAWTAFGDLGTARAGVEAVTAPGGVWLLGGSTDDDHAVGSVELLR